MIINITGPTIGININNTPINPKIVLIPLVIANTPIYKIPSTISYSIYFVHPTALIISIFLKIFKALVKLLVSANLGVATETARK